jgi:hypothetical protein
MDALEVARILDLPAPGTGIRLWQLISVTRHRLILPIKCLSAQNVSFLLAGVYSNKNGLGYNYLTH